MISSFGSTTTLGNNLSTTNLTGTLNASKINSNLSTINQIVNNILTVSTSLSVSGTTTLQDTTAKTLTLTTPSNAITTQVLYYDTATKKVSYGARPTT